VVILLIGATFLVRKTLLAFVIALMLAYLLFPLVQGIHRRLLPKSRSLAALIPFLGMAVILGVVGFLVAPHVVEERKQLIDLINSDDFKVKLANWDPLGIPVGSYIPNELPSILKMVPQEVLTKTLGATIRDLSNLIIIPILSFFLLRDGGNIRDSLIDMLFYKNHDSFEYRRRRNAVESVLCDAHKLILEYMRALLVLCFATLISYGLAFKIMSVPYGLLLALMAFPLEFVPLVGPLASAGIILGVCEFSERIGRPNATHVHIAWVIVFLLAYRIFQDYILSPMVMRRGVKLHPLLVIFGVLAGWELGKVGGVFLSVPILALARLIYYEWRKYSTTAFELLPTRAVTEPECQEAGDNGIGLPEPIPTE
jgi:predicted PurR-regulated permease PerM